MLPFLRGSFNPAAEGMIDGESGACRVPVSSGKGGRHGSSWSQARGRRAGTPGPAGEAGLRMSPASSRGKIPTMVTYLEMVSAPAGSLADTPAPSGCAVNRVQNPDIAWYRRIYSRVGEGYVWTARILMPDEELTALLSDPLVEVHLLKAACEEAGYVELDCRKTPDVEIAYFGIIPEWRGRGLGKFLLDWAIRYVWREKDPARLWLHTDDLDHAAALPLYESLGFRVFKRQREFVDLI